MKKIIIWDFDGPIVDSRELSLERAQYEYHDVDEEIHRNLFNGNIFEELKKLNKKVIDEKEYSLFLNQNYWSKKLELSIVAGIDEVIKILSEKYILVINSSSTTEQIQNFLNRNNLSDFFHKIYGSEVKSKKDKFEKIFVDFNVSAKECIFITDTLGDVLEGQEVDIQSIVVFWGYQKLEHFKSVEDKVIFANKPKDLLGIIEL